MAKKLCIFPWIGGKQYLMPKINKLIPKHSHKVDVFGGSAAFLLNSPQSRLETYNDLNSGLVNFFRVLQHDETFQQLKRLLKYAFYSREEFHHCQKQWPIEANPVKKAYQFFYTARSSFAGRMTQNSGWRHNKSDTCNKVVSAFQGTAQAIDKFHERFKGVQIENMDAIEIIPKYDHPASFFYVDPPYLSRRDKVCYDVDNATEEFHSQLIDILLECKSKVMVSGYDHQIYNKLVEAGWTRVEYKQPLYAKKQTGERPTVTEILWMNYQPQQQMSFF